MEDLVSEQAAPSTLARVERVAVATDRSPGARLAVDWAAAFARSWDASLIAIQAVPEARGSEADADADSDGNGRAAPETAKPALLAAELERSLPDDGPPASAAVVAGGDDIAAAIVGEATRSEADVIVVGSSGMRGRKQFLLGNVANRVTHLASCTVIVVNTTTGEVDPPGAEEGTLRGRAEEIAKTLGPLGLRQLSGRVLRPAGDPDGPRRLRESLEKLGPTFGKLGQILSTRPDLLSEEYREELASLQANVPPMSEAEVVSVMEAELGVPWEDVFSDIDPEPLAAGTIGQVHRARLTDGERVVVKVRRAGAAELVERDLALLARATSPLARSRRVRRIIDLPSVVEQLSAALREELDFTDEARNLERMASILSSCRRVAVPACHRDLSSAGLLVMDEVTGAVPVAEAPAGEERTEAARELLHSYYRQVLDEGFFHADPHPGNLLWADGTIWLLDLGMVGRLDDRTKRELMLILLAFAQGDVEMLADVSLDLSGSGGSEAPDMDAYRRDLGLIVEGMQGRSLREIQLIDLLNQLTALSVRHGVPLPSSIAMVGKALAQVELTVSELAPDLDPIEEAGRYFVRSLAGRLLGRLDPQQVLYEAERLRYRVGQMTEGLATITGSRPGKQLEVRFTSQRLEERLARAGRLAGLGCGAGLSWVAAVMASNGGTDERVTRTLRGIAGGLSLGLVVEAVRGR